MNRNILLVGLMLLVALAFVRSLDAQDELTSRSSTGVVSTGVVFANFHSNETIGGDQDPERVIPSPAPKIDVTSDPELLTDQLANGIFQKPPQRDFGPWPRKTINEIKIDIRHGDTVLPQDQSFRLINKDSTKWTEYSPYPKLFAWVAPNIRYQPLYFEDVALERYGQTLPPYQQSLASSLHFFKSLVTLPNQMRHDRPASCDYPLGFCRPGNPTPCIYQRQYFGLHVAK